jgi:hypothetical protein
MAQLILELDCEQEAELTTLAALLQRSPAQVAHEALIRFIASHSMHSITPLSTELPEASTASTTDATPAPAPRTFKHDHAGFGMLRGKLELDGVPVADGIEYQNRIRSEW